MPKYKVGDKVKVKDNLEHRSGYCMVGGRHSNSVVTEMLRLRGKIVTIEEAEDTGYRIHEDNGAWCWTDDMFYGAAHSQKYKVGDKVVVSEDIRDDDSVYYMEHGKDEGMYATGDSMANGKGSDGINPMLLMLMGDTDDADDLFTTIAMMTMMGGNTATSAPAGGVFGGMNPLMLLALSGDDDEGGKGGLMQMILMSQMMGGGLFQAPAAPTTSAQ